MKKRHCVLGVMAVFVFSLPHVEAKKIPAFEELDLNGDGYISRSEAMILPCLSDSFDEKVSDPELGLTPLEFVLAVQHFCADTPIADR